MNPQSGHKPSSGVALQARSLWNGVHAETGLASRPVSTPAVPVPARPSYSNTRAPRVHAEVGRYRLRLAESVEDRDAVCRLRFRVFNIELGNGLESSYETGRDVDQFDLFCDHLLVEDKTAEPGSARRVVGTYRMQSGLTAATNVGYYSEQEFDFSPYEALRPEILELGRASIDSDHRTPEVLTLLWRGIAQYATDMRLRYLIGCSSLNSAETSDGWKVYDQLEPYRAADELRTRPTEGFVCPGEGLDKATSEAASCSEASPDRTGSSPVSVPRLLRTYLAIGARVCSVPAWDREFGTIDFLTFMDLRTITSSARNRFLAPLAE